MINFLKGTNIALALAVAFVGNGQLVEFKSLLSSPRSFHHRNISLVGFAHAFGDAFAVYETEDAAAKRDVSRGVFVRQPADGPDYDRFDNQWIRISGVIDANEHGNGWFPCGITVERVQQVKPPIRR